MDQDQRAMGLQSMRVNACLIGTAAKLGGIIRHPWDSGYRNWKDHTVWTWVEVCQMKVKLLRTEFPNPGVRLRA